MNGGFPTKSLSFSSVTSTCRLGTSEESPRTASLCSTTLAASFRQIFSMCFCRLRTPLSLQYQRIRDSRALFSTAGFRPSGSRSAGASSTAAGAFCSEASSPSGAAAGASFGGCGQSPTSRMLLGTR